MFQIFILLTAIAAILSYVNKKILKLPEAIGVMILAIIASVIFAAFSALDSEWSTSFCDVVDGIDFRTFVFDFLLGFLLFAGSLHVDVKELFRQKGPIIFYATIGVLVSTFLVGSLIYLISSPLGLNISYPYCLVFGALISPTDPIAVLALLKKAGAPKSVEIKIIGESLFNDGVGIVVFLSLFSFATMSEAGLDLAHVSTEFAKEVGGGIFLGLVLGWIGSKLMLSLTKAPVVAVHVSLAVVMAGYSLASALHVSGALAMVIAGLIIGVGMSSDRACAEQRNHLNVFWSVIDEILNSILFVLIGIEIIAVHFHFNYFLLGMCAILIVLLSRYIALAMGNLFLPKSGRASFGVINILTWAGLRGGISIALALTLEEGDIRDAILMATYIVVVFSIIVQGLTIERIVQKFQPAQ